MSAELPSYRTTSWAGQPKYECPECAFDTLALDKLRAHWTQYHAPLPEEPSEESGPRFDAWGQPIDTP